jgi:hypothetical protein
MSKQKENWLVSYPKSGSNLIRYVIEYLTERPTEGYNKKLYENKNRPLILRRNHRLMPEWFVKEDNLVILIRDYKELCFRENGIWSDITRISKFYKSYFEFYNSFEGNKKIIYYEDIIDNFSFVNELVKHYKLPLKQDVTEFIRNEDKHRLKSLAAGNPYFSDAKTKNFHQKDVNKDELFELDSICEKILGSNYKYVKRYKNRKRSLDQNKDEKN